MHSWLYFWFRLALLVVLMCPLEYYAQPAPGEKMPVQLSSADAPEYLAGVELAYAVRKGNLARAEKALAAAPSLLAEAKSRQMLLVLAAQEGHPGIVEWLLANGASPTAAFDGVSPLAAAVDIPRDIKLERQEQNPAAWQLIRAGGKITTNPQPAQLATDPAALKGSHISEELRRLLFSPLSPEILVRKTKVIDLLLAAQAKPWPTPTAGTAGPLLLFDAIAKGFDGEVIGRLIAAGADPKAVSPSPITPTPLHAAAISGNLGAAKVLLACSIEMEGLAFPLPAGQPGLQVAAGGLTPLMVAIWWGNDDIVRLLLEQGAKLEQSNRTLDRAVHVAAYTGQLPALQLLLDHRARIDYGDFWQSTPLHYAALYGRLELVQLLLGAGADMEAADEAGFTPLLNAVEHDQLETVKYLLSQGANRRARTFGIGKGPLRVAATSNALKVAEHLLELGEKVDGELSDNMRPLHEAVSSGHPQMVTLLLQHGASTELPDLAWRGTPLNMAVRSRPATARQWNSAAPPQASYTLRQGQESVYLEIIQMLATHGADLNAADRAGNTALHCAAEFGDREVVELLLKLGARRDLKNGKDKTPYDIAWLKGQREVCRLLQTTAEVAP